MLRFLTVLFGSLLFSCVGAFSQTTVFTSSFVANSAGNAGLSYRQTIPAISTGGTTVSVSFNSTPTGAFTASHASVCVQASSYNCAAAPIELTFGGASGINIAASGASVDSDFVNLTTIAGQALLVIIDVTSANMPRNAAGPAGWDSYPNTATTWNVASPGGTYVTFSTTYGISRVRVNGGAPPPPPPPPPSTGLTADGIAGGGRITIAHGVAKLYQDTQASFIDYAPDVGVTVPLIDPINGVVMTKFTASDTDAVGLSMTIDSTWPANGIFDVYGYLGSGSAPNLCTGPQWSGNVPAVPDQLFRGVKVNAAAMSCRSGPSTSFACAIGQCSNLGTVKISPVAGIIRCDFSSGKNRECGIWNKDNRVDGVLLITDPTATAFHYELSNSSGPSTPPGNQVRPVNGDAGLNGTVLVGRLGPLVDVDHTLNHRGMRLNGEASSAYAIGIGWNDPHGLCGNTVYSGNLGTDGRGINSTMNQEYWFSGQIVIAQTMTAWCRPAPYQGVGTAYATEWQVWYSGQNWIDSGDFMMKMKFRY